MTLEVVPPVPDDPDAGPVPDVTLISAPTRWFDCSRPAVGAAVRGHVLLALNLRAVDPDVIADAMVLVSELVGNVRDHTPSERLGVRVRVEPEQVVVAVVEDRPHHLPIPPNDRLFTADGRGRGLRLVDALATAWGLTRTDDVTTAWFVLAATSPAWRTG